MQTVLIVIHLMIVLALVGVVLIQRSEGGGLGIGGGSGFMSARGTANALTRTTGILAALFFLTSLGLGLMTRYESRPTDILNRIPVRPIADSSTANFRNNEIWAGGIRGKKVSGESHGAICIHHRRRGLLSR